MTKSLTAENATNYSKKKSANDRLLNEQPKSGVSNNYQVKDHNIDLGLEDSDLILPILSKDTKPTNSPVLTASKLMGRHENEENIIVGHRTGTQEKKPSYEALDKVQNENSIPPLDNMEAKHTGDITHIEENT